MIASVIQPGLMLTMHAIRRQLAAMPRDLYYLRLIHDQAHRPFPGERLWTAEQLLQPATIRFLRARNRDGFDIFLRPDAWDQNPGYILVGLERADSNVVDRKRREGHHPRNVRILELIGSSRIRFPATLPELADECLEIARGLRGVPWFRVNQSRKSQGASAPLMRSGGEEQSTSGYPIGTRTVAGQKA
jgi:hypothetical protein